MPISGWLWDNFAHTNQRTNEMCYWTIAHSAYWLHNWQCSLHVMSPASYLSNTYARKKTTTTTTTTRNWGFCFKIPRSSYRLLNFQLRFRCSNELGRMRNTLVKCRRPLSLWSSARVVGAHVAWGTRSNRAWLAVKPTVTLESVFVLLVPQAVTQETEVLNPNT